MSANTIVRARIDEKIKNEAADVLRAMGLTVSDAFRMMMVKIAKEKALPFEPLVPNEETIEAMKAARRGELATVGPPGKLLASLNADCQTHQPIERTSRFRRDYKREKLGRHSKRLDAELMAAVRVWGRMSRCRGAISIIRSAASGAITATATLGQTSF